MLLLNDQPINVTMFPDKTSQVWNINIPHPEHDEACIIWNFEHEGEFLHLAQLVDLLRTSGVEPTLSITYLPYARQDKNISNNATFALRSFATLLNTLRLTSIAILDPHNPTIVQQLINDCYCMYPKVEVKKVYNDLGCDLVCYPDKGAKDKYTDVYKFKDIVYCNKVRNQATGVIEGLELVGEVKDKKVLLVDDLADGGRTFIEVTKKLLDAEAKEVYLFVTHGLFTKGIECLLDSGIKRIFSINNLLNLTENK